MNAPTARERRSDRTVLFVFVGTLALYLATLFPGVGGLVNHGDSAKFQFLGVVPGLSHPPGNPLYLLLLALAQRVPVATAAIRANALSAILMAKAVALVFATVRRLAGRVGGFVAALALALGGLTWTFGTEAEVYALAAAFVAAIAYCLARAELDRDGRFLTAALALFAVGLGNHLSLAMALPAGIVAVARLVRADVRASRRGIAIVVLAIVGMLSLYGLIPWFSTRALAYTEFAGPPDLRGLFEYVSARQFRGSFAIPTLLEAVRERPIAMASILAKQWFLPLYLAIPLGHTHLARRAPILALALGLASVAWLAFAFVYAIPDAEGFYVPVFVVFAIYVGLAVVAAKQTALAVCVTAALLTPVALVRFDEARRATPYDLLEDVGYGVDPELLDLADLVRRIPRGALVAVPCSHYGCGQVTNYYRFADTEARARRIEFVTIAGGNPHGTPSPPRSISADVARSRVVCTIHANERSLMIAHGASVRTIARGMRIVGGVVRTAVPVHCSSPE